MDQATSSTSSYLSVAITRERTGYVSRDESEKIRAAINKQIISEACSPNQDEEVKKTFGPIFSRRPEYADGVLKLWCKNDETLAWLQHTVSSYDLSLVVKSQSEIQKRYTSCRFMICEDEQEFIDSNNIGSILSYQNPWIDFKRWEIFSEDKNEKNQLFISMRIPEDQIQQLMRFSSSLSVGLGPADIQFLDENYNWRYLSPRWDEKTKQFVTILTNITT